MRGCVLKHLASLAAFLKSNYSSRVTGTQGFVSFAFYCPLIALEGRQGQNTNLCVAAGQVICHWNNTTWHMLLQMVTFQLWKMALYSCDSPPLLGRTSPQVWVSAQESVSVQITQQMMLRRESLTCLLLCITDLKCICKLFSDAILTGWPQRSAFLLLKEVCVYFSYYLYCDTSKAGWLLYFITLQTSPSDWKKRDC